jgi:hypothetical protein
MKTQAFNFRDKAFPDIKMTRDEAFRSRMRRVHIPHRE